MQDAEISPCCLTIAGSDCGGNAGVQADLRAFHAYGLHGCTVFTAMTAQNPRAVTAVHALSPEFVAAQLDAVLGVYDIRALKTGMLATADIIRVVARKLRDHPEIKMVIDPVMVSTSGAKLISDDAVAVLAEELIPLATLVTPNLPEAHVLAGDCDAVRGGCRADDALVARELAERLGAKLGCAVLVKGGHGSDASAVDVMFDPARPPDSRFASFDMPWIRDPLSTHGTGCSLAAALAANLAKGRDLADAVRSAKHYVHEAIRTSFRVGPDDCGVLGFVHDL